MIKMHLVVALLSISNFLQAQTIYLLKQWHLPPKVETTDIELSKKLSQFQNQKSLFEKVNFLIIENKIQSLLSEGCEKIEIDAKFKTRFNGWTYEKLEKLIADKAYSDILTLLPLKAEVLHKEKVKTVCVDDLDLIHQSELALSDVRAYVGYSSRLDEFKKMGDQVSYDRYASSILSEAEKNQKLDALVVAKKKALDAITLFETINTKREQKLVKNILDLKLGPKDSAAFVIGGIHVDNLSVELKKNRIQVEIFTPEGYVENDKGLVEEIKRKLQ